jgi:hypothetical protein
MSNTALLIKRSLTTGIPGSLKSGELAYSYASNTIFIGSPSGTGVVNVGGQFYTSQIDAATNSNNASTIVKRDSNGAFAGQLQGAATSAGSLTNATTFSIAGDVTATAQNYQGNNNVTLTTALNTLGSVSAGTYGSSTLIPIVTVGANGRVLSISTTPSGTSGSFTIAGNTGTSTFVTGNTFTIEGNGSGIQTTSSTSGGNVLLTVATDNTVLRSNTTGVGKQVISTDLTIAGNLIVSGTQTIVNTVTVQTNTSLLELAANNVTGDVVDIGFYGASNTGTSVAYHGLIREGSGGTNAGNFYLFKNLATAPTNNTVSYSSLTRGTLFANLTGGVVSGLANAIGVLDGGTGTTTSTGTGSVVLNTNPTFAGQANFATINVASMNVNTINVVTTYQNTVQANSVNIGTLTYAASGAFVAFAANNNSYEQVVIQNYNLGSAASADYIVSNADSTDGFLYGDFGINGPNFSGGSGGALDKANNVYLYASNADLAIGTSTANSIHFVVNDGATDAMTIFANGVTTLGTALGVPSGGTGASSFAIGQVLVGNASGALQSLANSSLTTTGSGAANNTVTSLTVDVYGRTTALTYSAISGLTTGQGGTGASSFTLDGLLFGNGTGAIQATAAAGTSDQTWSNQIMTVTNAGVPTWSTALDGGTF